MAAYYNEHDKNAAAWIRELIKAGAITDGEVDERSIEDVLPADLAGFERCHDRDERHRDEPRRVGTDENGSTAPPGETNGFWGGAEWVYCNDPDRPKWRPIKPGTFPLAPRAPGRVALLRGYGNSIVAPVAQAFIEAYLEEKENMPVIASGGVSPENA